MAQGLALSEGKPSRAGSGLHTFTAAGGHCGSFAASTVKPREAKNMQGAACGTHTPSCYLASSVFSLLGGAATVEVVLRLRFRFCTFCSGWNRMT